MCTIQQAAVTAFEYVGKFVQCADKIDRALAFSKGKWFHVDKTGQPIYCKQFDWAADFSCGLAGVRDASGYYHIRPDGSPAYPQRYSLVTSFYENEENGIVAQAVAQSGTLVYTIGPNGSVISSFPA